MKRLSINTVFIKAESKTPALPHLGQKVHIKGDPQIYVVLQVDAEKQVADLVSTGENHSVKEGVPFDSIQPAGTGLAEAITRMLKSA